jgi:hypothetical protein
MPFFHVEYVTFIMQRKLLQELNFSIFFIMGLLTRIDAQSNFLVPGFLETTNSPPIMREFLMGAFSHQLHIRPLPARSELLTSSVILE